ncbi:cytochrome P450 [Pisolithus thermaeus]|nr:cytochrome P450 [Pisolithus thermaeus]
MLSDSSQALYILATAGLAGIITIPLFLHSRKLDAFPTVGSTNSWRSALKNMRGASGFIQEGYGKYKNAPFKIPMLYNWIVVVSGTKLLDEVRVAPDDQLSAIEGANDFFKTAFTMGHRVAKEPYHLGIIKTQLSRKLPTLCPVIENEVSVTLSELFSSQDTEWKPVVAMQAVQKVVSRAMNRIFVGLPLCSFNFNLRSREKGGHLFYLGRNPDWLKFGNQYAIDSIISGAKMDLFPRFMWPLVAIFLTSTEKHVERAVEFLGPAIRERRKLADRACGREMVDIPDDFLQWLIENGTEDAERDITRRILFMVLVSIQGTASTLMSAVYNLAAHPEYFLPLREEVDAVVRQDGWTKAAIDKMYKIDSFLKESYRLDGVSSLVMIRKVLKDFTFSDGRIVPKGCYIAAPSYAVHHDEEVYEKPDVFDPYRFVRLRSDEDDMKQQMVSLGSTFLPFGHGNHACPGRFSAAVIQKTILAHIVSSYDLKLDENAPASGKRVEFGIFMGPDPTTTVLLRKKSSA